MRKITLLAFALITAVLAYSQEQYNLIIEVTNIPNNKGTIMLGIYNTEKNAFDPSSQYSGAIEKAKQGNMTFKFSLPAGEYAVGIIHDENNNGELDKNILGIPKEGYGFSGSATRPVYKDARFVHNKKQTITIKL